MRTVRILIRHARTTPVATTFLVAFWALGFVHGGLLHRLEPWRRQDWGVGVATFGGTDLGNLFTSAFLASSAPTYLLTTVLVLAVRPLEQRWGSWRWAVVAAVLHVGSAALTAAIVAVGLAVNADWFERLPRRFALGPVPFLLAMLCISVAYYDTYLRRRVLLVVSITCVTLFLYSGRYESIVRMIAVLIGTGVCALIVRHREKSPSVPQSLRDRRVLMGLVVASSALGPLLAVLESRAAGPLSVVRYLFAAPPVDSATVAQACTPGSSAALCSALELQLRYHGFGPAIHAVVPVLLIVVLADGLRRGRRVAWVASVVVQGLLTVFGAVFLYLAFVVPTSSDTIALLTAHTGNLELLVPALQPLLVLSVLLLGRRLFTVTTPPSLLRRAVVQLAGAVPIAWAAFTVLVVAFADWFTPRPTITAALSEFWLRLVPPGYLGIAPPRFLPQNWPATIILEWTGIVVWVLFAVVAFRILRARTPVRSAAVISRARSLLLAHGDRSIDFMTTWPKMEYWFDVTGEHLVSYRNDGSVALVLGHVVGPAEGRDAALAEFIRYCDAEQLAVAFYSITAEDVSTLTPEWQRIEIGREAVIALADLKFTGKKFQDIRTAVNRAAREGVRCEWIQMASAEAAVTAQIDALFAEPEHAGAPELEFTIGGREQLLDPAVRILAAIDEHGVLHGVTSWLPVYRAGDAVAWTLDVMRRTPVASNGIMECMIATALQTFSAEGAERASLSAVPLAGLIGPGAPTTGVMAVVGRAFEGFYDFRSLFHFKTKFGPTFEPLFLAYRETTAVPAIGNALLHAYLPNTTIRERLGWARKPARRS